MNPDIEQRTSEIAGKLVMTALSLTLVAGYVFLFQVFRADRQGAQAAAVEQPVAVTVDESLSFQERE